jgi:nucleoside-diphosphate-sugar epimerase
MRILITGANGYIGKTLHNTLRETHYVDTITRSSFDLTNLTAMSKFFQSRHHFDVVIHCAVAGGSRLQKDDWSIMDKNLMMYYNLLHFRRHYTKLIHFGSGAETYMPSEPYGYSKKVIAKSILNQDNFYNIKIFGVFDENELETRFIKGNISRYINNEPMQIHQNKFMDFFYMQDLVKVVEYYINEQEPPKEFDCVYEEGSPTLTQLSIMINELDDHKVKIFVGDADGDSYTSKYRSQLPIEFIGLEQGIKNVYNKLKNATN